MKASSGSGCDRCVSCASSRAKAITGASTEQRSVRPYAVRPADRGTGREVDWHPDCKVVSPARGRTVRVRAACAGEANVTSEPSIADSITRQACSAPASPAVYEEDTGRLLTYGTLDSHADRLAGHLRTLGAARDRVVAIVLPRSADLVVAALATLRTGAAVRPVRSLDARTPPDRDARRPPTSRRRRPRRPRLAPCGAPGPPSGSTRTSRARPPRAQRRRKCGGRRLIWRTSSTPRDRPASPRASRYARRPAQSGRWHHAASPCAHRPRLGIRDPAFDASVWEVGRTSAPARLCRYRRAAPSTSRCCGTGWFAPPSPSPSCRRRSSSRCWRVDGRTTACFASS